VGDTLQSISARYGIGWHTLFLMNNSTLLNPIDVLPGSLHRAAWHGMKRRT
jgi:hypothetical protein